MELSGLGNRSRAPSITDSAASDLALNVQSRSGTPVAGEAVGDHYVRDNAPIPMPIPVVPAGGWRKYIFIVPVISAAIASVGAAFSIRNWAYLDSKFTLRAVNELGPILTDAHQSILNKLSEIADLLRNQTDGRN